MFSITKTEFIYFHLKIFFIKKKTPSPSGRNLVDLVKKLLALRAEILKILYI